MTSNYHFIDGRSTMVIVSKCPRCGAPIYAPNIWHGNEAPPISHTCECRNYRPLRDYLPSVLPNIDPIREGTGQPPQTPWPVTSSAVPKARQVGTQPDSTADTVV